MAEIAVEEDLLNISEISTVIKSDLDKKKMKTAYNRLMKGGGHRHRDCGSFEHIKAKWLALMTTLPHVDDNFHKIVRINEQGHIVSFKEPMTLGQSYGIKFQALVPGNLLNPVFKYITDRCEKNFNQPNQSAIDKFIEDYHVNEDRYEEKNYSTLNEYFIRRYNDDFYRCPKGSGLIDNRIFRSPATSYTTIYRNEALSKEYWIKDEKYTVYQMINNKKPKSSDNDVLSQHMLIINRLGPGHYHRFHVPVSGTIVQMAYFPGALMSVSAKVVKGGKSVYIGNKRVVLTIHTKYFGTIYMVIIGAVCVGSIQFESKFREFNQMNTDLKTHIKKNCDISVTQGEDLGYFQYGGSTIITVIPRTDSQLIIHPIIEQLSTHTTSKKKAIEFDVDVFDPLILADRRV